MSQMRDDFSKVGEDVTKSWSGGFAPKSGRVCSKSDVNRIQVTEEKIEQESKLLRLDTSSTKKTSLDSSTPLLEALRGGLCGQGLDQPGQGLVGQERPQELRLPGT